MQLQPRPGPAPWSIPLTTVHAASWWQHGSCWESSNLGRTWWMFGFPLIFIYLYLQQFIARNRSILGSQEALITQFLINFPWWPWLPCINFLCLFTCIPALSYPRAPLSISYFISFCHWVTHVGTPRSMPASSAATLSTRGNFNATC